MADDVEGICLQDGGAGVRVAVVARKVDLKKQHKSQERLSVVQCGMKKKTIGIETARAATREKSRLKKYFTLTRNVDGPFNPGKPLNLILGSCFFDVP